MTKKTAKTKASPKAEPQAEPAAAPKPPNKNQVDAQKRMTAAQRRVRVAEMYHANKTQEEIAERLGVAQSTVSGDLKQLREQWSKRATDTIGEWIEAELAFAMSRRADALREWRKGHEADQMRLVIKWTERIAKLLGLDAPDKVEDWTDQDWRAYAQANKLDTAEVIAEAERIIADAKGGEVAADGGSLETGSAARGARRR